MTNYETIVVIQWRGNRESAGGTEWPSKVKWVWKKVIDLIHSVTWRGGPRPGPKSGLLSNTRKWILRGGTHADKTRDLIGKGRPSRQHEGKRTQKDCSATWLAVSGFMVVGLVSGLSLANHSDSGSFWVARASLSLEGFQRKGFWELGRTHRLLPPFRPSREFFQVSFIWHTVGWRLLPPFSPSWILPVSFQRRIGTSCCKTAQASGYQCAWRRLAVSVSGSLTTGGRTPRTWDLEVRGK